MTYIYTNIKSETAPTATAPCVLLAPGQRSPLAQGLRRRAGGNHRLQGEELLVDLGGSTPGETSNIDGYMVIEWVKGDLVRDSSFISFHVVRGSNC